MKDMYQYGHCGWTSAMSRGERADKIDESMTRSMVGMRSTKYPVKMLVVMPITKAGRILNDAPRALLPWTSWKLLGPLVS